MQRQRGVRNGKGGEGCEGCGRRWWEGGSEGRGSGGRRTRQQSVGNILGALYLAVLFLGIINSRTVQPPAFYERSVRRRHPPTPSPSTVISHVPFASQSIAR